jgi:hypothetical protein
MNSVYSALLAAVAVICLTIVYVVNGSAPDALVGTVSVIIGGHFGLSLPNGNGGKPQ